MYYFGGVSDLAGSWAMRRNQAMVKSETIIASQELVTGFKDARKIANAGDVGRVFAVDKELKTIARYNQAMAAGRVRLDATQASIGNVRTTAQEVTLGVLALLEADSFKSTEIQAAGAIPALRSVVTTLNGEIAGHSLFSGAAIDRAPLKDGDEILADIEAIMAAAPDVATAISDVDFYFDDPAGGFATSAYFGSANDAPDVSLAKGDTIAMTVRADTEALRDTMKNLAIIGAVSNGAFAGVQKDQRALMLHASEDNLQVNDQLIKLQERVGYSQERLERASVRNEAERMRLSISRTELTGADPYESAGRFQELEAQMEKLYSVTVKLSKLSLVNFMR